MKNRMIAIVVIVIVTVIAWISVIKNQSSNTNRIEELTVEVNANLEVETYKNTLPLYAELIELDSENMNWYIDLSNAYFKIGQYKNYEKMCNNIIKKFPESNTGYLMLLQYYTDNNKKEECIKIYKKVPESLMYDPDILSIYEDSEWAFRYLSKEVNFIDTYSGGFFVVEYNKQFGYWNDKALETIIPNFDIARPFIEEYAAVNKNNEWYFIDNEGDRILATKENIEDLYSFSEGYAAAKIDGKYGFINKEFTKNVFEYDFATNIYNKVAAVKMGDKWALINSEFELLTEFIYDNIIIDSANICSRKGVIFAQQNGSYHMLNTKAEEICQNTFEDARLFYSDYAAVKKDGKWGFIDKEGQTFLEFQYDDAKSFNNGIAPVKVYDNWGLIDLDGKFILDAEFNDADIATSNGIVTLKIGPIYRFIQFYKFK